jgi:hypothetical protein
VAVLGAGWRRDCSDRSKYGADECHPDMHAPQPIGVKE